ncbi:hypothetical protein B5G50_28370, partial [Brevibacillus brevis]
YATVLPGALEYEFPTPKIEKYSITYWNENTAPANWTFDGWDGTEWVQLDKQVTSETGILSHQKSKNSLLVTITPILSIA